MSDTVLKRLNVSDVFTIPYEANKLWTVTASNFTEYGIFFQTGSYTSSINKLDYTYSNLLYKSVLFNYYPEFYPVNTLSTSSSLRITEPAIINFFNSAIPSPSRSTLNQHLIIVTS